MTSVHRLLGVLPLSFFVLHALTYWSDSGWPHMFWMCISGNLLVGAGLLLQRPLPLRIGALWLSLGLGLWFGFSVMREGTSLPSVLAHVGGFLLATIGVARAGMSLNTWLYAAVWYVLMQQVCRLFTSAELNVNLAHRVYDGWESIFPTYGVFWVTSTLLAAFGLWMFGRLFYRVWPAEVCATSTVLREAKA